MSGKSRVTPAKIIKELDSDYFKSYESSVCEALNALHKELDFERQIELCGNCLRTFWARYASKHIARILETFPRVQRALFGLEENRDEGARYRDHYIHMFDVFITGSRILSQIIKSIPEKDTDDVLRKIFKVTKEPDDLPFPRPYSAKQRLFFLWTLISTFHDIGIPVEHLGSIRNGLNRFLKYFGLRLNELNVDQQTQVSVQLENYFSLTAEFYQNGVNPNREGLYKKPPFKNLYMYHALSSAYGENNHGVISAVCLFNSYEETFLKGHHEDSDYDLSNEQYSDFIKKVLEQDIARAALAISLHTLDIKAFPKLFPIDPRKLPLTYLLVLCDELQEPFRHEGITYKGISKLKNFPEISVKYNSDPLNISVTLTNIYKDIKEEDRKSILEAAAIWGRLKGLEVPDKYPEFILWTWNNICDTLESKLLFSEIPFSLEIRIYLEKKKDTMLLLERSLT